MISANPLEPAEPEGGLGGLTSTQAIRDTRLIERAIRERWPIADEKRGPLVRRQVKIALSKQSSPREATAAFRAVLMAEAQNIEQEKIDNPQATSHDINITLSAPEQRRAEIVARLLAEQASRGIVDGTVVGDGTGNGTNGHNGTNGSQPH